MSILIKGMEMPKDGSWRSIRIYPDGTIGRPIGFGDYALVEGAKAVPVPPHGRLIEKSALLDDCYTEYEDFMNGKIDGKTALLNIERKIKTAPTIIPAEEGE